MNYGNKLLGVALLAGLTLNGSTQAWSFSALPFLEAAQEVPNDSNLGLLNRLGALVEGTKTLGTNTKWLSDSINYVGRPEVVDVLNKLANAINYVGRPDTLETIKDLTAATNKLTEQGVKINTGSLKALTVCGTGAVAALCGIGIITHTALRDDAKNARTKYIAGTCLTAFGIASVLASNWLNK